MNEQKLTWQKYILHRKLTVVCCIDKEKPHMVEIEEILLAGLESKLPFAYCPKHRGYFGISADVDMKNMIIKLR